MAGVWRHPVTARAPAERSRGKRPRWSPAQEAGGMLALILVDIWLIEPFVHMVWLVLVGLAAALHLRRGEGLAYLGFGRANLWRSFAAVTPLLLGIGAIALALGLRYGSVRPITPGKLAVFVAYYCLWGLVQQYALNGFFVNRFAAAAAARGRGVRAVPLVAAASFALVHVPNWFLVLVTVVAGWICASLYLRYRNLYPLGIAHGLLGTVLYFTVPDAISLHFHVGPGAMRWERLHPPSATAAVCAAPHDRRTPAAPGRPLAAGCSGERDTVSPPAGGRAR